MLQAFSVNSTPLGQTNSLPRASSKASVWSAKLKMSVVLCRNVAFHLPAVCSLSVTKSCSMRKHHIYWADNPSVLTGLFHPATTERLCYFFINSDSQMCVVETIPEGGRTAQKKKGMWKKVMSCEQWTKGSCSEYASGEKKTCVILRAIKVSHGELLPIDMNICDVKATGTKYLFYVMICWLNTFFFYNSFFILSTAKQKPIKVLNLD